MIVKTGPPIFYTAHHFTQPPKSYALQCFSIRQTPKSAPSRMEAVAPTSLRNTCSLGPTRLSIPKCISIGSAVFAQLTVHA